MESKDSAGKSEPLRNHPEEEEATDNGCDPNIEEHMSHFSSPSSSFSSSSSSDSPNVKGSDANFLDKSEIDDGKSPGEEDMPSPDVSGQNPEWSMMSVSPRAGMAPSLRSANWSNINASPRPPPIQKMGRPPPGYDPNRIPSSVFTTKPSAANDWSVASNESLFSIYMGNNSFTRDQFAVLGFKSGELAKLGEFSSSPYSLHSINEAESFEVHNSTSPGPPAPMDAPVHTEGQEKHSHENSSLATENDKRTTPGSTPRVSDSTPVRLSIESPKSHTSFAFPILANDVGKDGATKATAEYQQPPSQPQMPAAAAATQKPATETTTTTASWWSCSSWSYFYYCSRCC